MPFETLNGAKIYYQDQGKGFPIVLAHGLGGDHTMWVNQVAAFKDKYRVVVWDVRGHGRSEVTETGYSIEQFAEDQYALMRHLGIQRAHIGGLSMGGWIAWTFALAHPECTVSLILSDSAGYLTTVSKEKSEENRKMFEASAAIAEKKGRKPLVDVTLSLMFSQAFIKNHPDIVNVVRKRIEEDPGLGYANAIRYVFLPRWDTPEEEIKKKLAKISVPTLVLVGDLDALTPLPTQKSLAQAIPGARLEIIPNSGHVPIIEQPEIWNRLVGDFIKNISA